MSSRVSNPVFTETEKPGNPGFFQNRKTGFWLPVNPVFSVLNFYLQCLQPRNLLINVEKTKVMASDGIACRILIQNELLEQVDTFPYLGSLITEDGECTTEFRTRLNRGQAIEASLQKIGLWKSQHTGFNEDTTNESASVACSNIWL